MAKKKRIPLTCPRCHGKTMIPGFTKVKVQYAKGWKTETREISVTCTTCGGSGTHGYTEA